MTNYFWPKTFEVVHLLIVYWVYRMKYLPPLIVLPWSVGEILSHSPFSKESAKKLLTSVHLSLLPTFKSAQILFRTPDSWIPLCYIIVLFERWVDISNFIYPKLNSWSAPLVPLHLSSYQSMAVPSHSCSCQKN